MNGPGTELTGRVAIVTGASRGIGRQLALELARHGTEPAVATSTAGLGSMLGYAATKAALSRLTNVLAPELAPHRIAVVAVDPGFTRTELVDLLDQGGLVDAACAHGMDVPVGAILRIITAPDRLAYTGRIVRAARLG